MKHATAPGEFLPYSLGITPSAAGSVTAYLDDNPSPTRAQAREAISGNLCRCTGYQNIVASVLRAAELRRERAS